MGRETPFLISGDLDPCLQAYLPLTLYAAHVLFAVDVFFRWLVDRWQANGTSSLAKRC